MSGGKLIEEWQYNEKYSLHEQDMLLYDLKA